MSQTDTKHRSHPRRSEALIQRDVRAYEMHVNGLSVRAIGEEIGLKSSRTAWDAINRGRKHVEENGIDVERRKIEIDQLFKNTLGALAQEVRRQCAEGRIQLIERSDGTFERRTTKGVDPRTAEALARSADRWGQFLGLTDRANEVTQQAVTMVQLSAPDDGAALDPKTVNDRLQLGNADYARRLCRELFEKPSVPVGRTLGNSNGGRPAYLYFWAGNLSINTCTVTAESPLETDSFQHLEQTFSTERDPSEREESGGLDGEFRDKSVSTREEDPFAEFDF